MRRPDPQLLVSHSSPSGSGMLSQPSGLAMSSSVSRRHDFAGAFVLRRRGCAVGRLPYEGRP